MQILLIYAEGLFYKIVVVVVVVVDTKALITSLNYYFQLEFRELRLKWKSLLLTNQGLTPDWLITKIATY